MDDLFFFCVCTVNLYRKTNFISIPTSKYILISIFSSCIADLLDPHFQTLVIGDLSSCKLRHLTRQTASNQADTVVKSFASTDSTRPFKFSLTNSYFIKISVLTSFIMDIIYIKKYFECKDTVAQRKSYDLLFWYFFLLANSKSSRKCFQ